MDYIPRPKAQRVLQEIYELLEIHMERIDAAPGVEARRDVLRSALLSAYEAGINAQRDVLLRPPPTKPPPK